MLVVSDVAPVVVGGHSRHLTQQVQPIVRGASTAHPGLERPLSVVLFYRLLLVQYVGQHRHNFPTCFLHN